GLGRDAQDRDRVGRWLRRVVGGALSGVGGVVGVVGGSGRGGGARTRARLLARWPVLGCRVIGGAGTHQGQGGADRHESVPPCRHLTSVARSALGGHDSAGSSLEKGAAEPEGPVRSSNCLPGRASPSS